MQILLCLLLAGTLSGAGASAPRPKNVILLVGDGMGSAHVTATRHALGDECRIARMPVAALVTTHAADAAVTDSAAAASAFATGVKTNYRAISVDAEGVAQRTVLEAARDSGKSTGLVTTSVFWDATPAAFAAHAKDRYRDAPEIAAQILRSGVTLIVSGGRERLGRDGLPSLDDVRANGYAFPGDPAPGDGTGKTMQLFDSVKDDMDPEGAPLAQTTRDAIEKLRADPDGFFLLVEHEGIDGTSHNNRRTELRDVMVSFDRAVGVALDFAAADGETLVVVVGDHETGGLRITEGRELRKWRVEWSTTDHTGVAVPLFAYGPGASLFSGMLDNTDVGRKLLAFQGK